MGFARSSRILDQRSNFMISGQSRTAPQKRIDSIYQEIRYRICTNRYPPDSVLREEDLAKEYSVSRSPIRRVFSMLEHEGLVEVRHGVGTMVKRIEPDRLADVYAVRLVLAEAMGPFIETPISEETREFFVQCEKDFKALVPGDTIGFAEVNIRYIMTTTGMSTNATLREMQRNLFFQTSRMWLLLLPQMSWDATITAVCREHREIVRRIDMGDPVGLAYALRNHIFEGQQMLLEALRGG